MSRNSSGKPVRDWLLDKYTNAAQNLREQKIQIVVLEQQLREAQQEVRDVREQHTEDLAELHSRIGQLSPTKQFEIWYRQPDGGILELVPLAVGSCNGVTTITVERKA